MVDIQGVPSGEVDGSGIKLHLTDPQAGHMYIIYIIVILYIIYTYTGILYIFAMLIDNLIVFQRIDLLN